MLNRVLLEVFPLSINGALYFNWEFISLRIQKVYITKRSQTIPVFSNTFDFGIWAELCWYVFSEHTGIELETSRMGMDIFFTTSFQFPVQYLHILITISILFKCVNFLNLQGRILGMEPLWDLVSYLLLCSILKFSSEVLFYAPLQCLDFTK